MTLLLEMRRRALPVLGPAAGLCAIAYFAYHGINGDRGLIAWRALESRVQTERTELARVQAERQMLEQRVQLLNAQSLDPDMLDEWARRTVNYGQPGEVHILLDPKTAPRR